MREELRNAVRLGSQAEQFLNSEFGKAVVDRASKRRFDALERLVTVSLSNPEATEIQNEVRVCDLFVKTLNDILKDAEYAQALSEQENDAT